MYYVLLLISQHIVSGVQGININTKELWGGRKRLCGVQSPHHMITTTINEKKEKASVFSVSLSKHFFQTIAIRINDGHLGTTTKQSHPVHKRLKVNF